MLNFIKKTEKNKSITELISTVISTIDNEKCPEIVKLEMNKVQSDNNNENITCEDPCEILFGL